jgi:hypothetical protein
VVVVARQIARDPQMLFLERVVAAVGQIRGSAQSYL